MTEYREISLADREWFCEKLRAEDTEQNFSFGSEYVWRKLYGEKVAVIGNCGAVEYTYKGVRSYAVPFGGTDEDKRIAVETMLEDVKERGEQLRFVIVTATQKDFLQRYFPRQFLFSRDAEMDDYIYSAEKLRTLSGSALSPKRNHIHQFERNEDWSYETLTKDNAKDCLEYEGMWLSERKPSEDYEELTDEQWAVRESLLHLEELGFTGGVLRLNGRVIAFCIAERLNQRVMIVHFEKAETGIPGAYAMINREFVKHECEDVIFVNREDDAGEEGLRRAKLSYHPDHMAEKYTALSGDFFYASEDDIAEITELWTDAFPEDTASDVSEYLEHYYTEERILCLRNGDKIACMGSLFPLQNGGVYLYALATRKDLRGQGYGSTFIKQVRNMSDFVLLQPSQNGVTSWYESMGFAAVSREELFEVLEAEGLSELTDGPYDGMKMNG